MGNDFGETGMLGDQFADLGDAQDFGNAPAAMIDPRLKAIVEAQEVLERDQ
jgi:hypothetical protein